jgi:signal transduction histidine kinase
LKAPDKLRPWVSEETGDPENSQKELVNRAMEAGRVQMSAIVLHNIGNAITPIKVHLESMRDRPFLQIARYLEKSYEDLNAHADGLQHYVREDPRGKEVFVYLRTLIEALKEEEERRTQVLRKMDEAVSYISEILTLQQGYAASAHEPKGKVDLNLLVEDAIRMQAAALEKRKIVVRRELHPGLPKLFIEKNRLIQVIINLIKNSYEAVEELNDPGNPREILFRSFAKDRQIMLEITDAGVGIESGNMQNIGSFGQSTKGSSGFGLYYCKVFLEAKNGFLHIQSEGKGKGTTVTIALPAAPESPL